jgi:hypothetical protein
MTETNQKLSSRLTLDKLVKLEENLFLSALWGSA